MDLITVVLNFVDSLLGSAVWFPFALLGTGLFLTLYLGFPQIRYFRHALQHARGKYDKPGAEGDATHFQALTTAISGTVGTGNIGGVAFAIFLGGPAALFWMWATAFVGMTSKFVEVTLSHKYREKDDNGHIVGGPMYVMEKGLNMKWLAVLFAIATVISSFGSGNLPQSRGIADGVEATFGVPGIVTGGVLAVMLGLVLLGGVQRIIKTAQSLVPTMSVIYVIGALAVILWNLPQIGPSFAAVFSDAFTGSAAAGGFLGASFAYAFNRGVNRGLFSNEAGQGSAPIAHAAAKADEPVSEGMVSILEPFIDTIIICTLTALVILSSGVWTTKFENGFGHFDMEILEGHYSDQREEDREALFIHLQPAATWPVTMFIDPPEDSVSSFSGEIEVVVGEIVTSDITILHNRSVAEDVTVTEDGEPFTGVILVENGTVETDVDIRGRSLVHSVELTTHAFKQGAFGDWGQYIVSIGLVLFAFSTAVAWSYYGDRSITYLLGVRAVVPYRVLYVLGFFVAAIVDTGLIWLISAVTVALMTLPNLLSMIWLREEMKATVAEYWEKFEAENNVDESSRR